MSFKNIIRDYFTFNRRERNGVFVLLSIILLLILYLSFSDYFFSKQKIDFSTFEKEIEAFESGQKQITDSMKQAAQNYFSSDNRPPEERMELFAFNPNNLPEEDWQRLGLSDKQVRVIKNYESKGGRFYKKEDVKKMYCITPKLYASLEPYIQIPSSDFKPEFNSTTPLSTSPPAPLQKERGVLAGVIELNSADTNQLKTLKGIGSVFAKRIIKLRDALGGFVRKEQLMEVFGFDKEKYEMVSEYITVDASLIQKMNINLLSAEELKAHPYIRWKLANIIFAYRKNHGRYNSIESIKNIDLINDSLFTKLAPYLTIE